MDLGEGVGLGQICKVPGHFGVLDGNTHHLPGLSDPLRDPGCVSAWGPQSALLEMRPCLAGPAGSRSVSSASSNSDAAAGTLAAGSAYASALTAARRSRECGDARVRRDRADAASASARLISSSH